VADTTQMMSPLQLLVSSSPTRLLPLWLLYSYIAIEIVFYLVFRWYLIPRANRRTSPPLPFRDYPAIADRHQLLLRILKRLLVHGGGNEEKTATHQNESIGHPKSSNHDDNNNNNNPRVRARGVAVSLTARQRQVIQDFLWQWFHCSCETVAETTVPTLDDSFTNVPWTSSLEGTDKQQQQQQQEQPPPSKAGGWSSGLSSTTTPTPTPTTTNYFLPRFKHEPSSSSSSSSSTSLSSTSETRDPEEELFSSEHAASTASAPATCCNNSNSNNSNPRRQSADQREGSNNNNNNNNDDSNADDNDDASSYSWTVPGLAKENTDQFFAWAFFGKHLEDMTVTEQTELNRCYEEIRLLLQLVFYPRKKKMKKLDYEKSNVPSPSTVPLKVYSPRRLTLEDVDPIHRPLLVYILVAFVKVLGGSYLRWIGFQRMVSKQTGLVAWYRPARTKMTRTTKTMGSSGSSNESCSSHSTVSTPLMPLLFFHGIAPGGLILYLPMVLKGLLGSSSSISSSSERISNQRDCFLFENHSISCTLRFSALTEDQTVVGVQEIVETALGPDNKQGLTVVGHSFGSCPLTWLLHSRQTEFRHRIRQLVLIDPVTILLSEPDVMINFLYARTVNHIRMVASSELFTEYYLRRHFAWYNSELWLEDLCRLLQPNAQILVCLSEHDEILNAPKVKKQIDRYVQQQIASSVSTVFPLRVLYWTHVGHANCVSSPQKWKEMQQIMLEQELALAQHDKVE